MEKLIDTAINDLEKAVAEYLGKKDRKSFFAQQGTIHPQPFKGFNIRYRNTADTLGHHDVARCGADALADAVEHAGGEDPRPRRGEDEGELVDETRRVADERERLLALVLVGDVAREDAEKARGALGDSLDDADESRRGTEGPSQEQGDEGIDHLGGEVCEEADEAEDHDVPER